MSHALALVATGAVSLGLATAPSSPGLQQSADDLVRTSDVPAVVALVEQDGRRTAVAAGLADVGHTVPALPDDRFWVGSVTKTFVASVVMQLVAEGKLRLDDTVERRLPGLVRAGARVRIRHLLSHTSGISEYMRLQLWNTALARNPRAVIAPERLIASAARLPLEFGPGTQASYSNTNYLILAEIVERVDGGDIGASLRKRILRPLRLNATAYERGGTRLGPTMRGYELGAPRPRDVTLHRLGGPWGDGAIVSNTHDLTVFFGALLRGKVVQKRLLRLMTTIIPGSHGEGMGLAQLRSPCKRGYFGHTGGTPGYATFAAGTRDGRRVVVVAVNGIGHAELGAMGRLVDRLLCP